MTDETHSLQGAAPADGALHQETRRDFLQLVAAAVGAVAVVATGYVLVDMLNPAADVLAAGGPVDIDLTKVAPGQQVVVQWRGKPIFIVNRTPPLLKELQDTSLVNRLGRPEFRDQPAAALCTELAPLDQTGICGSGWDLYPSRVHSRVLPKA